ncbi:Y-family DNA polymerase [Vibrio sp. SCSIO 43140]|uniref:Y-family DNA polymerase n=1 Tax=Vibrio sp. SCSIO 43140 TaxID=2819100 RepID=UPI00207510FD|nr:Y-family DNA polymerase [Vibrio sp. SCSIO 43140]USD58900.1 Y-family DNA polymerase [Vibrio sp. SCSIO 43140]
MSAIALVDANAFYCAAHQVFDFRLRNKPIVVLSNNDGMLIAVNKQAKNLGIKRFRPYFEMKPLLDLHKVTVFSSTYELYGSLSKKMHDVIASFGEEHINYSIDEAFLLWKNTELLFDYASQGKRVRETVWKHTRLPVCVGISKTATLAKVANHIAKKVPGYDGVCTLMSENDIENGLRVIEIGSVWGIGHRREKTLKHMGVTTALDLARSNISKMRKEFGVDMERTVRELNGEQCFAFENGRADKQQIYSTRSVGERITTLEKLQQALSAHADIASAKARQQKSLCKTMIVFAGNSPFDAESRYNKQITHHFDYPTADVGKITRQVSRMAEQIFTSGVRFYKIGVGLIELVEGKHEQYDLFASQPNNELMKVYDDLNSRFGKNTIFLGAQGIAGKQDWKMRRDRMSPLYTTSWNDIPVVKC